MKAIPRGIIYHRVMQDVSWLLKSFSARLDCDRRVSEFESAFASYMGVDYCVSFPLARTAIYYTLRSLNLPHGSEVIMPPITIKGILDVVLSLDLVPVFVDIDENTLCFDYKELTEAIGSKTRVAIITYLFGMVPDVAQMAACLKEHGVFIIEDFSQCLGGTFKDRKVGTFGDVGVYSASSIKTLDTYGGGLLICCNEALHGKLRQAQAELAKPSRALLIKKIVVDLIRNVATTPFVFYVSVFPILKLMNLINPTSNLKHIGRRDMGRIDALPGDWFVSYTSLQASVGLELLSLVEQGNLERAGNVDTLKRAASSICFPKGSVGGENVYWQLVAYFSDPYEARAHLQSRGIDSSTTSLVLISSLPDYPCQRSMPIAERLHQCGLFMPCYPGLSQKDIRRISDALNSYMAGETPLSEPCQLQ